MLIDFTVRPVVYATTGESMQQNSLSPMIRRLDLSEVDIPSYQSSYPTTTKSPTASQRSSKLQYLDEQYDYTPNYYDYDDDFC